MTIPRFTNASGRPATIGGQPQPQQSESMMLPSPTGVNAMAPIASMSPQDCVYTYNIMPSEYGLRTRLGYKIGRAHV